MITKKDGNVLVGIQVKGYERMLIRTPKQFLAELKNCALIGQNINDINHPVVLSVRRGLMGGIVAGKLDYHKAGSFYLVPADSPAITDKTHRLYGKVAIGDPVEREAEGFYADDLLKYMLNERSERLFNDSAQALTVSDLFDSLFDTAPDEVADTADVEPIAEAIDEAELEAIEAQAEPAKAGKRGK